MSFHAPICEFDVVLTKPKWLEELADLVSRLEHLWDKDGAEELRKVWVDFHDMAKQRNEAIKRAEHAEKLLQEIAVNGADCRVCEYQGKCSNVATGYGTCASWKPRVSKP